MGYSISIKFKDEKQKQQSIHFIKENKDIINQIVDTLFTRSMRVPSFNIEMFYEDGDIPYGPKGKNLIGWKECGIPKGLYCFVIWLAFKNGQSFYYYDDEKNQFTLRKSFDENLEETQVDSKGFLFKEQIIINKGFLIKLIQKMSNEEEIYAGLLKNMNILEEEWNKKLKSVSKMKIK